MPSIRVGGFSIFELRSRPKAVKLPHNPKGCNSFKLSKMKKLSTYLSPRTFQRLLNYMELRNEMGLDDCGVERAIGECIDHGTHAILVAMAHKLGKRKIKRTTGETDN